MMSKKVFIAVFLASAIVLLISGFASSGDSDAALADTHELKWSIVDTPSQEDNVVVSPSEINAIVRASDSIFYATDIPNEKVYKTADGGITWDDDLTEALEDASPALDLPAWDIAVAPDNAGLLAVVTDDRTAVYVSDDGGEDWRDSNVPELGTSLISDIAISSENSGNSDIAIGTREPDGVTNGDIWVLESGPFASWEQTGLNMDISSVVFSPGYETDGMILAVASDDTGTYLCSRHKLGDEWSDVIPPIEIEENGSSPAKGEIILSDLALSSATYAKGAKWTAYIAYYSVTEADDAYRINHEAGKEDAQVKRLNIRAGDRVSLASIDYHAGKLVAGEVSGLKGSADALIHICSDPERQSPTWKIPSEPPTGGAFSHRANAQVIWGSTSGVVYCGTSTNQLSSATEWALSAYWSGQALDESAFSVSKDGGDSWNQLSLIDTAMTRLSDYALSANAKTLYLASINQHGFDSLWRSQSAALGENWQRILCFDSESDEIILRPTPSGSGSEAIFFAVPGSYHARYSLNKGETWKPVYDCPLITDLAVVSDDLFYVLEDNLVNKCARQGATSGGFLEWQTAVNTGLHSAHSIDVRGEYYVFVAEDENGEGRLAYSTDAATTFRLTSVLPDPGSIRFILDEEFTNNRLVYASSSEGKIYRWAIGTSSSWRALNPSYSGFTGLVQEGGALYGAYAYREGVGRTLIPRSEIVTPGDWDSLAAGLVSGVVFAPGSLRAISDGTIDLWAIDADDYDFKADAGCLWAYSDSFVMETPWPTSPAMDGLISCDDCACQAKAFCFRWREISSAERYEIWIALDEDFNEILAQVDDIRPSDIESPTWCPSADSPHFSCGETYYWKVRSSHSVEGEVIHSRWSPTMYFGVKVGTTVGGMHIAPVLRVPEPGSREVPRSAVFSWLGFPGTTAYGFILAEDAALTQVLVTEQVPNSAYKYEGELDWGTTYFWQVRAIEPLPSEPAIASFTVVTEPEHIPAPLSQSKFPEPVEPETPVWIWVLIGVLTLLTIVLIVSCLVKR
jgi:hypothetical protein